MDLFTYDMLSAADEIALARSIEAGLFAQQLLDARALQSGADDCDATDAELMMLVHEGEAAHERLWRANLRLVRMLAARSGRTPELVDDAFQEGCIGLAEAIMVWDHRQGTRFSTVAYPRISYAIQAGQHRFATGQPRRHERRLLARVLSRADELTQQGQRPTTRQLSELVGAEETLVHRLVHGGDVLVEHDRMEAIVPSHEEDVVEAAHVPAWLERLSPLERRVLCLRYGLGCVEHSTKQTSELLHLSDSTVRRIERRALSRGRQILGDRRTGRVAVVA